MRTNLYLAAGALAVCAGHAHGAFMVDYDASMSFAGTDLDGIVGNGIPNSNFVRATNTDEGIEIGLKAIERFIGDLPNTNERYFATTGVSAGSPPGATWNYVLAADLGVRTIADLQINLQVDFDPTSGVANFVTVDLTSAAILQGGGGLSVFGDSQNLDFSFWQDVLGAPAFDPNAPGEYELIFSVIDPAGDVLLAETQAFVQVVPTPGAAGLLALGGLASIRRRR